MYLLTSHRAHRPSRAELPELSPTELHMATSCIALRRQQKQSNVFPLNRACQRHTLVMEGDGQRQKQAPIKRCKFRRRPDNGKAHIVRSKNSSHKSIPSSPGTALTWVSLRPLSVRRSSHRDDKNKPTIHAANAPSPRSLPQPDILCIHQTPSRLPSCCNSLIYIQRTRGLGQ